MNSSRIGVLLLALTLPILAFNAFANNMNAKLVNEEINLATASKTKLRVATFNVSMEALNYLTKEQGNPSGTELFQALNNDHQQIKNIAEIIQKINPDIILLNEFDYTDDNHKSLKLFIQRYLAASQGNQNAVIYPYYYQAPVNTGVVAPFDFNNNNKAAESPADTYGFGFFPGHFGMALLSKYPIDVEKIRTFQLFKWKDMPNALQPIQPETSLPYYNKEAWENFRLSSKSHWDIPVNINGETIHILASHPTPPVFDGPEDRNGKRNHDEIRFWYDYITPKQGHYIYDDKNKFGGIVENSRFVILGDLNASSIEGDAINSGIESLITHQNINDVLPESLGGKSHSTDNINAPYHTAYWRMRADYVLPSVQGFNVISSGVFWPEKQDADFRLIKDRQASSDHRLVWVDLNITPL